MNEAPISCVRSRRIDLDWLLPFGGAFESELQAPRFTDPVRLHQLDFGRPVVEPVDGLQQALPKTR